MKAKIGFIAMLLAIVFLTSTLDAQERELPGDRKLSASLILAGIGFDVYTKQVHAPFLQAKKPRIETHRPRHCKRTIRNW